MRRSLVNEWPRFSAPMQRPCASCCQQSGQSGQVICGHRQNEAGSHSFDPAIDGLRHATDGLGPAEGFLDPLSVLDRQGVALMSGSASVDCEIWAKVGDARSGGCLRLAEPVAELNPLDDFGQAILAVEFAPFLLRRHHQLEGHDQTGLTAEAAFGAFCAVSDSREGAFDRV
jgi:hypothetical protein